MSETEPVPGRPSGTVTFLFTDVEGSTATWELHPEAMRTALALHDELLRSTITARGGHVFSTGGDGVAAVFDRAEAAVRAAIGAQQALGSAHWPDGLALRVRMGLHTGEAQEREGDFFGPAVNRAARVMDAANGAQILASASTREVVSGDQDQAWIWVDLGVHELRDVVDPMRLYRIDSSSFESDPRPPRSGSVSAGNLPARAATLVGRSDDVETILRDLASGGVVTLTGVGGIGKTQLALAVGRAVQSRDARGVWFAPLDTIDQPESLLAALLGLLSIERRAERDRDSLVEGLRFRDALLILDNCEHLLDAVADVAAVVVSSCPKVRVLATSREPLDIDGERVRRIRSLTTDDDGEAVALFRLRAEEAGASLDLGRDGESIAQVCRRLDGIPLAIELAAARARSLRPAEIADRLDDMFRLLAGGRRTSTERHRTLRATLEWSHEMLSNPEQAVLARLSIFAGSFPLDAAEAIAGAGDDVSEDDIVRILDRLVARSLVVPTDEGDQTRFRLLEPVRQLAAEKLAARGEAERTRRRHTDWYVDLMVRLDVLWRTGNDQAAWPVAARELANLRAAFDHLVEAERIDEAERFVVASYGPIGCQFDSVPMYEWAPRARAIDPEHIGPFTASVWAIAAWGATAKGDLDSAAVWLGRGVDAIDAGSHDDGFVSAAAIHHVLSGGQLAVSDDFLARSVRTALESDDLHRQVWVLIYSGRFSEALERAQRLGNLTLVAVALGWETALTTEDRNEARERYWEAAQESHSYLVRNHAAIELGSQQIEAGAAVDGLLLLRAPARDWLIRGDTRVWNALDAIAVGFATFGDFETAARMAGAIGHRTLPFVTARRRALLTTLLDTADPVERFRHEAAGKRLDAGTAVAEALARIEALAGAGAGDDVGAHLDEADLTARQHEVAELVARGFTNKQVAQRLGISRYTAETHVRNILERLGAASRSEIATWFARQPATGSGTPVGT